MSLTILFLSLLLVNFNQEANAQAPIPNEAEWTGEGYALKKIVSNTSIQSGVNFSYTIMFSAPAGATSINIQDAIPDDLVVVNVPPPSAVNGVTPSITYTGSPGASHTVHYTLTGLPAGSPSSGSFTIVVKFPEGVTCDGTTVRNRAEILIDDKPYYTPYVSTTASAVDPWKVAKTIIDGAVVNPSGGSCGYMIAPDGTVTYRLYVMKNSPYYGNVVGQINMDGAVVTDVLPAGAVVTASSCSGIPVGSTGTLTWNVNSGGGGLLDATIPYAYYYCEITVQYPVGSFPTGSIINNELTLDGTICDQPASHMSNQTCVEVVDYTPNQSANFQKYISLANRVPGCTGLYQIVFCNNGNVPLTAFNINDVVPSGISVDKINIYNANATTTVDLNLNGSSYVSGITSTYSSGTITSPSTVTDIQLQMTGSLPVGDCIYLYVYFTIEPNPTGTVVTNCASFDGLSNALTLSDACVSFTVEEGTPKPCVVKDICSPQTEYDPGDILRFRVRVQNIGSADISGATFQDVLNSNFTYVGNESYYVSNTYNPACSSGGGIPSGTLAWTGVSPSHSGSNLSWSLPDIPSDCQLFYSSYCGTYGISALPYYFIEFDVMVDSFAMPGVTPNDFDISGGNLSSTVTSNTVNVLVVASFGQEVEKEVSTDGGTTFGPSGTVSPGGTARYRLNYKNTSNVPVSSVNLVDLLPMDDGTNDWLILNRSVPRGSSFGVDYVGSHTTVLVPGGTGPTPALDFANDANMCLPIFSYSPGACNGPSWGSTPQRNIKMDYTTFALGPNIQLQEEFDVLVPAGTSMQQTACNDFAGISSADFLLDGTPQSITLTPIAAPPVCIIVDSLTQTSCCDSVVIESYSDPASGANCCVRITTQCPVKAIQLSVENGTISSASASCTTLPTGYVGQSSFTFPGNGCEIDMIHCFTPDQTGSVTVNYVVMFDNGETCRDSITIDCGNVSTECCDSISLVTYEDPDLEECCVRVTADCEIDSVLVTVNNGIFGSNSWNCSTPIPVDAIGQSTYTFNSASCILNMTNCFTADQPGVVSVSYVFFLPNGEKCEKQVQLDCNYVADSCCKDAILELVHSDNGCCVRIKADCEIKQIEVDVTNGVLASTSWNCGTVPDDATGVSNYIFDANDCMVEMTNCFDATQSGVITVNYTITFANGEKCEKSIQIDCVLDHDPCCAEIDFKLKPKWPFWNNMNGQFTITNIDPTEPICYVELGYSATTSMSTGSLYIDGTLSSETWTPTRIPAVGNLSPAANNTIKFNLNASGYNGLVTVCVVKCDGTRCCFEFKWNSKPWGHTDVPIDEYNPKGKLVGISLSPMLDIAEDIPVKYVSFGFVDETEIDSGEKEFFAISGASFGDEEQASGVAITTAAYMGKHSSFFELETPVSVQQNIGAFNLVFANGLPKLGCTLFDPDGNIIAAGEIDVTEVDTVATAVINVDGLKSALFDFVNLYPNPSEDHFTVTYVTSENLDIDFLLVNQQGQVLQSKNLGNVSAGVHNNTINVGNLPAGVYKAVLKSGDHLLTKSVVIK